MPTTVQQVEALPEGLVTLDAFTPKINLISTTVENVDKEKPAEVIEKSESVSEVEITTVQTPKTDLFETIKHVIPCSLTPSQLKLEVNIFKEKEVTSQQRCFILTVHDYGFDSKPFK
jgi:hypothetical protein